MDFRPRPSAAFASAFEAFIDAAMQREREAQPPRNYIGASVLGEECLRMLAYEYHKTPRDEPFGGRILRIFERGHTGEDLMARRLRLAGFKLVTQRPDGQQIRFGAAWSEERQAFRMSGGVDGVLTDGPAQLTLGDQIFPLAYPALWENKVRANKYFNEVVRKGLRAAFPVYFAQMQLYMGYLGLADNPGLFTTENADTGELYAELVPFDAAACQEASDRGVRVIETSTPEEAPKVASKSTDYRCKLCDFAARCWAEPTRPAVDYTPFQGFGTRG